MPRTKEAFEQMKAATKKNIDNTALELFACKGLSVTVGEIAKEAGISQGLLYNHYSSKDELIKSLIEYATNVSSNYVEEIKNADMCAKDKITEISKAMYIMFTQYRAGMLNFMFMLQVGLSGKYEENANDAYSPVESLAEIIVQGQREQSVVQGEPMLLSVTYWACVQGICSYIIMEMPFIPEVEMLSRILVK